jgi:hypothetical protein
MPQIDQDIYDQLLTVVALLFELNANFSSEAKIGSTQSRNEWMAASNKRLRPRFGVFRLRGFSLIGT